MTRSELRIGNIIDRGDYHCKVTGITEDGIMTEPINYEGERFVEQITKPILLTEEWLVKFGFEYDVLEEFYFEMNGIRGQFYEEENSFEIDHYELANCYYVHQLQNLYFALTGKELKI